MQVLEKVVRISDQLDEQLHAGFYFYIPTSPSKFVSNSVFIWPMVVLTIGVYFPQFMAYATFLQARRNTESGS
jgi:hypothetical protein